MPQLVFNDQCNILRTAICYNIINGVTMNTLKLNTPTIVPKNQDTTFAFEVTEKGTFELKTDSLDANLSAKLLNVRGKTLKPGTYTLEIKHTPQTQPGGTTEEVAIVELTLEQVLEMRMDEVVGPAIEEGLDNDPEFYRPFKDKSEKDLQFEREKCDALCVAAALKNETPERKIDATRRDIKREQELRTNAFTNTITLVFEAS